MVEPGGLPSMGSHRVGHDLSDLGAAAADIVLSNTYISHNIDTIYSQQTKMANTCKIVSLDSLRFSLICKNSVTYSNH